MKKTLFFFIISALVLMGCAQIKPHVINEEQAIDSVPDGYVGKIDSNYTERNNYVKQYCIDQKIDNNWYSYIDDREEVEMYGNYGFKNTVNDEIMVLAQYMHIFEKCFDNTTMRGFAAAKEGDNLDRATLSGNISNQRGIWYRNPNGEKIIQSFIFDNGPDYFKEGLSRYIENGKVGYMNEDLEIIIPAQFDGAGYFENGVAGVCNECKEVYYGEHSRLEGGILGTIDKNGTVTWDK